MVTASFFAVFIFAAILQNAGAALLLAALRLQGSQIGVKLWANLKPLHPDLTIDLITYR